MSYKLLNLKLIPNVVHPLRVFSQISRSCLFNKPLKSGTVIISLSNDIYSNLALEEWIFKRIRFEEKQCLLVMWTNDRTIVFGRHQNPWDECHINVCKVNNVNVCRRQSGGGAVYHDLNNLNISFFTNKNSYNRRNNLMFLKDALREYYGVECDISAREDLILKDGQYKISGTASKLASHNAYHHCTLLVDVDIQMMRKVIRKQCNDECINEVHANEDTFPGITELIANLKSWQWIYGKTPRFTVKFEIENTSMECKLVVYHGIIESVHFHPAIESPPELEAVRFTIEDANEHLNEWTLNSSHPPEFARQVHRSILAAINNVYN